MLQAKAQEVRKSMEGIEGIADLKVQALVLVPQLEVEVRPEAAARFGVTAGSVRRQVAALVRGLKVGEVFEAAAELRRRGLGGAGSPQPPAGAFAHCLSRPSAARPSRSSDLAEVRIVEAPNEITRERASRRLDVTANVSGRSLGAVARDVEAAVGECHVPGGVPSRTARANTPSDRRRAGGCSMLSRARDGRHLPHPPRRLRLGATAGLVFGTLPFALVGAVASPSS